MISLALSLPFVALLPSLSTAHGHIAVVIADGIRYPGWNFTQLDDRPIPSSVGWVAKQWSDWSIDSDKLDNPDIICHREATPGQLYVPAKPGQNITFQYNDWPIQVHPGPALSYVAECIGDCTTTDKTQLKWVKFWQKGLTKSSNGQSVWATDEMVSNGYKMSITIPNWKPGNYVIRHELINLYRAVNPGRAELYPQCINFKISGSGKEAVTGGKLGTQLYNISEAGLFSSNTGSYTPPGPPVTTFTYP